MRKFHILSSVALAFSLFFTLGTTAMQAQDGSEFAGGNGTEADPWQIATKQQLAAIDKYGGDGGKGKYFILTRDLDFTDDFSRSGDFYNDGKFWKPLCGDSWDADFQGTLDGNNHEIIGLRVNSDYSGLFAYIEQATIKNLTISYGKVNVGVFGGIAYYASGTSVIENCHVKSDEDYGITIRSGGGLIGQCEKGYIISSSFVGKLKQELNDYNDYYSCTIGGIVGIVWNTYPIIITDSFVEGDISCEPTYDNSSVEIGGMVGRGLASISNCYVKGNISAPKNKSTVGGFFGHAGSIFNYVEGGTTIEKSYFQGNITGNVAGGLIGWSGPDPHDVASIYISSSYADAKIQGTGIVGGLIGMFAAYDLNSVKCCSIEQSYSKGEIEMLSAVGYLNTVAAGGLVGLFWMDTHPSDVLIEDCYSHCNIKVSSKIAVRVGGLVGGLVGYGTDTVRIEIQKSYAMGKIEGDQAVQASISGNHAYVGGLLGQSDNNISILKSVAMNPSLIAPHGDNEDTGRIIGSFVKSDLGKNYALDTMAIKVKGKDVSVTGTASDKNGQNKTSAELAQQSTYTGLGWDFNNIWKMSVNGYPIFMWKEDTPPSEFAGGDGTEKNPWQIATKQQLVAVNNYGGDAGKGKYFILTRDLDFTDDFSRSGAFYNDGKFWLPLCGYDAPFQGNFDGNHHEIIGLRVNSEFSGLFGYIEMATIKNLTVSYGKVDLVGNTSKYGDFGGIACTANNSVVIENCHVKSDEDYGITIRSGGGLIGNCYGSGNFNSYVIGSSFTGKLKQKLNDSSNSEYEDTIGGIVGKNRDCTHLIIVQDSFVEGDISCDPAFDYSVVEVGGMIGFGPASIYNSYVKGNISAPQNKSTVGGLIGGSWSHTSLTSIFVEHTTIEQSYFQGSITGHVAGGLIGWTDRGSSSIYVSTSIISSYSDAKIQGTGIVGGLIGMFATHDLNSVKCCSIEQSYSKGEIEMLSAVGYRNTVAAGGLVGLFRMDTHPFDVLIEDCYSHCNIKVSSKIAVRVGGLVGGLVGYGTDTVRIEIQKSYAMGKIEGDQAVQASISGNHAYVGGLLGQSDNNISILKSVAMNPSLIVPHGDNEDTGRIIGSFVKSDLGKNYALDTMAIKVKGKDVSVTGTASDKNGLGKTAAELAQQSTYTGLGWDFNNVWKMNVNGYPILAWEEDKPLAVAPSITSQPKSQTVNVGSSVTFSVTATGTEPLNYQWKKNGSNISGATASTYKINSVQTGDAGSYTVTVSNSAGSVTSSTATLTVNASFAYHPADTNKDKMIKITEVTAYGKAWKNGETWSVAPNPIPISYVTRAGALWKNGEVYTQDKSKEPPLCWENVTAVAAASASAYCTISGEKVTITVTPDSGVSVYAAEDMIPSGWTVTGINENGVFDSTNRKVKWGPWFDNSPRTLTYTLVVPSGFSGTATLSGTASFDGVDMVITGDRQYGKSSSSNQAVSKISGNQVTITVTPESGVSVYAAEDKIPSGLTVTGINESGVFDTANRKVKWGPWFDNSPRTLTYTLVPGSFTGTATLSGTASFDGVDVAITGDRQYTVSSAVKPTITTQPKSQTVNEGDSVTFSVVATDGSNESADFSIPLSSSVNLDMVWIEPGTFIMGSPESEIGERRESEPLHQVTLTKGFWAGKYEVTQAQYRAIMETNPSKNHGMGDNYPVYYVNWFDAMEFCNRLNKIEKAAGRLPEGYEYTLPTEAQWEYACRAGTTTAFNNGKDITSSEACPNADEVAWYSHNSNNQAHPVGQKKPNAWGLYDMHANVAEWCLDENSHLSTSPAIDPLVLGGWENISRGGTYCYGAGVARSAYRGGSHPGNTCGPADDAYGFRVFLSAIRDQASAAVDTLTYQWYKDGVAISGATGSSYTIKSVKLSDAGKYTVKVSNSAGFVTSDPAVLTVNGGSTNPNGTAVRSVTRNGKSATVTLKLEPDAGVSVMFVEEHVPSGVTISANNGGTYIASRNMIRWSFLDGMARDISYVLTVADSFDGKVSLSGEVTFDETTVAVTGTSEIDFAVKTHPADMNDDFEISTKEIASYALAWTKAQSWTREPYDIPVTYVARAAIIWVNGGYYTYDSNKAEPSCWVSTNVKPASVELASDSVNVRTINVLEGKADVNLEVIPASGISVYFVEEQLPVGMDLDVTNISDGGKYVEGRGLIRWSFLDAEPRTLTYTIEPEAGFDGVITVNGEVTFDEETQATSGDTEANFGGSPIINYVVDGKTLILNFTGTLYESEDTVTWTEVEGAESPFRVDISQGKKFYRCAQ